MLGELLLTVIFYICCSAIFVTASRDPELQYASEGTPVVFFACEIEKGQEYTEWGWLRSDTGEVIIQNFTLAGNCSARKYLGLQFVSPRQYGVTSILLVYNVLQADEGRYDCYLNTSESEYKILKTYDLYVGSSNKSVLEGGHFVTYDAIWPTIGGSLDLPCLMPPRNINFTAVWSREDWQPFQLSGIDNKESLAGHPTERKTYTGKVLSLRNINENHTGVYECSVAPWGLTTVISVNVYGSPIVTTNVSSVTGTVGSEVSLSCDVKGFLIDHFQWTKNGTQVQPIPGKVEEDFQNVKWNGFEYHLIFRNSTVDDFGEYYCEVGNDQGIGRSQEMTLRKAELIPTPMPIAVGRQSKIFATAGDQVELQCKFQRLGKHKILWENSTTIFAENTKFLLPVSDRWNLTQEENRWSFHISNVRNDEEGNYFCFVEGKRWIGQTIKLIVYNAVSIAPLEDVVALEGETLDLFCNATGSPPPIVKWARRDRGTLRVRRLPIALVDMNVQVSAWPEALLPLQPLQKQDAGHYYCLAENEKILEGRRHTVDVMAWVQVYVLSEPNVTAVEPRVSARLGTSAVLECTIEAVPKPKVIWDANGAMLRKSSRNFKNISYNSDGRYRASLTITRIRATDMQTYRCIARNSVGESAAEIVLTSSSRAGLHDSGILMTVFVVIAIK